MENEGEPAAAAIRDCGRMVEVRYEALADIENTLEKIRVEVKDMCSSDVISSMSFEGADNNNSELLRVLVTKQYSVRILSELVLHKFRNMIPRQPKGSDEDGIGSTDLKRPLSQLQMTPVAGVTAAPSDSKTGTSAEGDLPNGANGSAFDIANPIPGRLQYFRTSDNTKAAYQKPSISMFTPTPKFGERLVDAPNTVPVSGEVVSAAMSLSGPRRRPCRPRRERNRSRNKLVVVPEPVMQRVQPGDTNKIPDDGYLWRKYGNKPIKTASFKRGYYKCRLFKEVKCTATKIVQQTNNDPSMFSVLYKGEHTCKQAIGLHSSTCPQLENQPDSVGNQPDSKGILITDRVNEHGGLDLGESQCPEEAEQDPLDGLDWPKDDVSSNSASDEDLFPTDNREEATDSVRRPTASLEHALDVLMSPLGDFDMQAISGMVMGSTEEMISAATRASPWPETLQSPTSGDFKANYAPIEKCLPEGVQESIKQGDHKLEDDSNQVLMRMMMNDSGLYDHETISNISFWSSDLPSYPSSGLLKF